MLDAAFRTMLVPEAAMAGDQIPHYDRDFLLSPDKRSKIIEL